MSRFVTIDTVLPGELMAVSPTGANVPEGSIRRLNRMIGSQSQLAVFLNGANLDWVNFKPDAGFHRGQKVSAWSFYPLSFSVTGVWTFSVTATVDLLVWEPRPGTEASFLTTGPDLVLSNYTRSMPDGADAGSVTVYKQTQRGDLLSMGSINIKALAAPQTMTINWSATALQGESRRILPGKGERVIVRLSVTRGAGAAPTLSRMIGYLNLRHGHVKWND